MRRFYPGCSTASNVTATGTCWFVYRKSGRVFDAFCFGFNPVSCKMILQNEHRTSTSCSVQIFFAVLLFSSFVSGKFRLLIDFGPGLAEVNKFIWENDENRLENSGTGVTMFN